MAKQLFVNNFTSTFIANVKAAATTGTPASELGYGILQLNSGASAYLVNPTGGDYYILTAYKRSGSVESNIEIMKVTEVDNSVINECRITVLRAQEGTPAQAYVPGDYISLRITKGGLSNMAQASDLSSKQDALVSGVNLKTVGGASLLGGGDISVGVGDVTQSGAQNLTNKTYNGLSLTAASVGYSIAGGTTSKTLTVSNTLTLAGTDGSTLNIGTGGTLGTGAFATIANYAPLASPSFTGTAKFDSGLANYIQADGASASGAPALSAQGSDTNVNLALRGKGNGGVTLGSQSVIGFVATAPTSGVNYVATIGAATGVGVQLVADGGDANISMNIAGKGSGSVLAWSNGSAIFSGSAPASGVNFLGFSGQVAGQSPSISAIGSDANITLKLIPKGSGSVQIAGSATFQSQYDAGNSGTAITINFANGQKQLLTLTGNVTVTLSFPGVGNYQLLLTQDATGSRTVTWSGVSRYVGSATAPAINTAASSSTVVSMYYDGTNVWLGASKVNA